MKTVENWTGMIYLTTLSVADTALICSITSEYWRNEAAVAHLDIALLDLGKTGTPQKGPSASAPVLRQTDRQTSPDYEARLNFNVPSLQ